MHVKLGGRISGKFENNAHPACPYKKQSHPSVLDFQSVFKGWRAVNWLTAPIPMSPFAITVP